MKTSDLEFDQLKCVKFSPAVLNGLSASANSEFSDDDSDTIGGILQNGELAWIANGAHLEVLSVKSGQRIGCHTFNSTQELSSSVITCVAEIEEPKFNSYILAVGIQFNTNAGMICIFSVKGSKILRSLHIGDKITSCTFVPQISYKRSCIQVFDGCLAIGTDCGKTLLLDICFQTCREILSGDSIYEKEMELTQCHIVSGVLTTNEMKRFRTSALQEDVHLGVELPSIEGVVGPILTLYTLAQLNSIAVASADGRLILYDLTNLEAYHMAYPPELNSPILKMCLLEPAHDPRACLYLWAFHHNYDNAFAVMHSITFSRKVNDSGFIRYLDFASSTVRLTMPIFERNTIPIACQTVQKQMKEEEDVMTLSLLSWVSNAKTTVLMFDLNQWYKEQMPETCDWRQNPSFLASFTLAQNMTALNVWADENRLALFNSIQRPEEHFYPSSLTFDCAVLFPTNCQKLRWPGYQNKILQDLNIVGPSILLEPSEFYLSLLNAVLLPQFMDCRLTENSPLAVQRDVVLTIALEYNYIGFLKQCAKMWADGSHLGPTPTDGLSLSVITDWIWLQATNIRGYCTDICAPLFDSNGGVMIEDRLRKRLSYFERQLKMLAELMDSICKNCKESIPDEIYNDLKKKMNSITMTVEYLEVLEWLLNVGLLPEGNGTSEFQDSQYLPYPYVTLRNYYQRRRFKLRELETKAGQDLQYRMGCKFLYIDSFLEKECNYEQIKRQWIQLGGDGLYPPISLDAMLQIFLVPGFPLENKYALFVYLFLDLSMVFTKDMFNDIIKSLIKFPAVFKLKPATIKTTQGFWNLDHGQFDIALEELISPLSVEFCKTEWQAQLLIESLLLQSKPHFALQFVRIPNMKIAPELEMTTLLANNLVIEAFELHRQRQGRLMVDFFKGCLEYGNWTTLLELSLTDDEEKALEEFLLKRQSVFADNFYLLYLLQRSKYLDAMNFVKKLQSIRHKGDLIDFNTAKMILNAYHSTMTPVERKLAELYEQYSDTMMAKNSMSKADYCSLSRTLLKGKQNPLTGIYQTAMNCTKNTRLFRQESNVNCNVPFLQSSHLNRLNISASNVIKPEPYFKPSKRKLETLPSDEIDSINTPSKRRKLIIATPGIDVSNMLALPRKSITSFKDRTNPVDLSGLQEKRRLLNESTHLIGTPKTFNNSSFLNASKPHSILKGSITVNESNVTFEAAEKSIKFNLPHSDNEVPGPSEKIVSAIGGSARNSIHSTTTSSTDEFFSPNTSVMEEQQIIEQQVEFKEPKDSKLTAESSIKTKLVAEHNDDEDRAGNTSYESNMSIDETEDDPDAESIKLPTKLITEKLWQSKEPMSPMLAKDTAIMSSTPFKALGDSESSQRLVKNLAANIKTQIGETKYMLSSTPFKAPVSIDPRIRLLQQKTTNESSSEMAGPSTANDSTRSMNLDSPSLADISKIKSLDDQTPKKNLEESSYIDTIYPSSVSSVNFSLTETYMEKCKKAEELRKEMMTPDLTSSFIVDVNVIQDSPSPVRQPKVLNYGIERDTEEPKETVTDINTVDEIPIHREYQLIEDQSLSVEDEQIPEENAEMEVDYNDEYDLEENDVEEEITEILDDSDNEAEEDRPNAPSPPSSSSHLDEDDQLSQDSQESNFNGVDNSNDSAITNQSGESSFYDDSDSQSEHNEMDNNEGSPEIISILSSSEEESDNDDVELNESISDTLSSDSDIEEIVIPVEDKEVRKDENVLNSPAHNIENTVAQLRDTVKDTTPIDDHEKNIMAYESTIQTEATVSHAVIEKSVEETLPVLEKNVIEQTSSTVDVDIDVDSQNAEEAGKENETDESKLIYGDLDNGMMQNTNIEPENTEESNENEATRFVEMTRNISAIPSEVVTNEESVVEESNSIEMVNKADNKPSESDDSKISQQSTETKISKSENSQQQPVKRIRNRALSTESKSDNKSSDSDKKSTKRAKSVPKDKASHPVSTELDNKPVQRITLRRESQLETIDEDQPVDMSQRATRSTRRQTPDQKENLVEDRETEKPSKRTRKTSSSSTKIEIEPTAAHQDVELKTPVKRTRRQLSNASVNDNNDTPVKPRTRTTSKSSTVDITENTGDSSPRRTRAHSVKPEGKTETKEPVATRRTTRKASNVSTSEVTMAEQEDQTTGTPARRTRRQASTTSVVSLSSVQEQENPVPLRRSRRQQSTASNAESVDQLVQSLPAGRTRRKGSQMSVDQAPAESPIPLKSTRRLSTAESIPEVGTPTTRLLRSRRTNSTTSDVSATSTPKHSTKGKSIEKDLDKSNEERNSSPISTRGRKAADKVNEADDDNASVTSNSKRSRSNITTRRTSKLDDIQELENVAENNDGGEEYADSRRLTRGQRAVLDKITSGTHARRPTTRTASRAPSTVESEIPDDDNESVSSKASKSTTTSKGPGKRTRASSTESKSKKKKDVARSNDTTDLEPIVEEDASKKASSSRGRKK